MQRVEFHTRSGVLKVVKDNGTFIMDFPQRKPMPCAKPDVLEAALGAKVLETHIARDMVALLADENTVRELKPDFALLRRIDAFAVIATAKGSSCDFVSRFFAPNAGMDEDPVTGSSHCTLIPFWSERLHKTEMTAKQLSSRGGTILCRDAGDRVEIAARPFYILVVRYICNLQHPKSIDRNGDGNLVRTIYRFAIWNDRLSWVIDMIFYFSGTGNSLYAAKTHRNAH